MIGIRSDAIRRKLLATENLTFALAKAKVIQEDIISNQAKALSQALPVNNLHIQHNFKSSDRKGHLKRHPSPTSQFTQLLYSFHISRHVNSASWEGPIGPPFFHPCLDESIV